MENRKSLIALALIVLIGLVGGTFAYFTSSTTLNNEFTTGTYSTSVKEEFVSPDNWTPGTTTTKKVNVTNNGSVEVSVRASYTEKWLAADGTTVLSGTRDGEQVAQFTIGTDWELATDGYYYYKGTLTNGQTSSDFISSVTFNPNFELIEGTDIECTTTTAGGTTTNNCTSLTTGYAGAIYSLDITIETIQTDKQWEYTVASTTPTLISFTIDSTSYQAEEGMTWAEWVDSEYNTDGYYFTESSQIFNADGGGVEYNDGTGNDVYANELIDSNYTYTITVASPDIDDGDGPDVGIGEGED